MLDWRHKNETILKEFRWSKCKSPTGPKKTKPVTSIELQQFPTKFQTDISWEYFGKQIINKECELRES